jgi:hypothetical protein
MHYGGSLQRRRDGRCVTNKAFARKLGALQALRSAPDRVAACAQLRQALKERNNHLVARAAAVVAGLRADELIPDLIVAFDRFLMDPGRTDPQCLAKQAIVRALKDLGHHDADVYTRGIGYHQWEPTWGGRGDTAGQLRATCALALVECLLDWLTILTYLTDGLADADKVVRINSAIAIDQLNRPEGALLLRLKALAGNEESDVVGQCFSSLLNLAPEESIEFVSRFLDSGSAELRLEAASALAQSRRPEAVARLKELWEQPLVAEELRRVVLIGLGASPLKEASELLVWVLETTGSASLGATALSALGASRYRTEMGERVVEIVNGRDDPALRAAFEAAFDSTARRPIGSVE